VFSRAKVVEILDDTSSPFSSNASSYYTIGSRRMRVHEVLTQLKLGYYKAGPKNSLADVPGVLVHTE